MQRRENMTAYGAVEADSFFRKGCGSYWKLIFFAPFFLGVGGDPTSARYNLIPLCPLPLLSLSSPSLTLMVATQGAVRWATIWVVGGVVRGERGKSDHYYRECHLQWF
jgi:hypothetical protein